MTDDELSEMAALIEQDRCLDEHHARRLLAEVERLRPRRVGTRLVYDDDGGWVTVP